MLTAERLRELLDYDPESGVFKRRVDSGKRWKAGQVAGFVHAFNGYAYVRLVGRDHLSHRLAWLHVTGEWPKHDIDHIDGNKTNNRFRNLRDATESINLQNQKRAHKGSKSGILGAYPIGKRWRSTLLVNGKPHDLGMFETAEEAHAAYLAAKRLYQPGCTI